MLTVKDTELTIYAGRGNVHTKTRPKPRISDGKGEPEVTTIKPARKEHSVFYFNEEVDQALRECDEARKERQYGK